MEGERILLKKEYRRKVFHDLKEFHKVKTFKELSVKLKVSRLTLKKWIDGDYSSPAEIFPEGFIKDEFIDDIKPKNWGARKGGEIGIKKLFEKYPVSTRRKWSIKGGNSNRENLKKIREKYKELIKEKSKETKLRKRQEECSSKVESGRKFFHNKAVQLPRFKPEKGRNNVEDKLKFPKLLSEELAEEIGLHIGDGTLSKTRNYFALRGYSRDEYEYYTGHISKLYRSIYNFKPKIFSRGSICGFEKCSKPIFMFKTKILGLPYGKKSHIVDIPKIIKESRNEKIIAACIRGILDSDGCIWFSENGAYPRIDISSKSKSLIRSIGFYLEKMGFQPNLYYDDTKIVLYGKLMLDMWMEKIGTNHPKHNAKIEIWEKFGRCPPRLSYNKLKDIISKNALVV